MFEHIATLTPRDSELDRLGHRDERGTSKEVNEYATTSNTSIFHRLGTKRNSLSKKRLLEHENQDSCDVIDDKEIHSIFSSRMKRKVVLSITTDGSVKGKEAQLLSPTNFMEKPIRRKINPSKSS